MYIVFCYILILIFVHGYRYYLQINNKDPDCEDYLNKKLFDINLSFCWWNISHVITHFLLSYHFKASNIYDHLKIFLIGIVWIAIEYLFSKPDRDYKCTTLNNVYKNTSRPRYNDIFFNFFGQVIYIISQMPLK